VAGTGGRSGDPKDIRSSYQERDAVCRFSKELKISEDVVGPEKSAMRWSNSCFSAGLVVGHGLGLCLGTLGKVISFSIVSTCAGPFPALFPAKGATGGTDGKEGMSAKGFVIEGDEENGLTSG
jgi:hypothetical protein